MKLDKILVPVDASECSQRALKSAIELAELAGGSIDILHVAPRPIEYAPLEEWIFGADREPEQLDEKVKETATRLLEKAFEDVGSPENVGCRVELGVPSERIVSVAEQAYDLVVMGTTGRTGAARVLMGSVAERVVRTCKIPVLTIH
jgi:nucleotide-binding universal stress UspA family protein